MGRHYVKQDTLTLGVREEIVAYDFTHLGWDAQEIVGFIYDVAFTELVSRNIFEVWDWSQRVKNMFMRNRLDTVGKVMHISVKDINKLGGCGYKSRNEVFMVFESLGMKLPNWEPSNYWNKYSDKKEEDKDRLQVEDEE